MQSKGLPQACGYLAANMLVVALKHSGLVTFDLLTAFLNSGVAIAGMVAYSAYQQRRGNDKASFKKLQ